MTATIVLDANVLAKRVLDEPDSAKVRAWFNEKTDVQFVGPTLLFSESGRVLQKNLPETSTVSLREIHERLLEGVLLIPPTMGVWDSGGALTFYDAHYLSLAVQLEASVATTDPAMMREAKRRGISLAIA